MNNKFTRGDLHIFLNRLYQIIKSLNRYHKLQVQ